MNDDAPYCKDCSKPVPRHYVKMERIILLTNRPQFKGSGFYETDYKKKKGFSKPDKKVKKSKGKKNEGNKKKQK